MKVIPLLLALAIGGWGPLLNHPKDSPTVWTARDSWDLLTKKLNFSEGNQWNGPEDSIYIAPTQEEIDDLLKFIQHRRENLGYIPEANDCDDLSTEAKYWATAWSIRHYSRTQGALLFGKAYVKIDGNYSLLFPKLGNTHVFGYHVLCFVVRSDDQVLFFEPQADCLVPVDSFIYEGSIEVLRLEY